MIASKQRALFKLWLQTVRRLEGVYLLETIPDDKLIALLAHQLHIYNANCWVFLTKTILMFVKNIITIEEAHYLVIHHPFKYFRESWEKADGSIVFNSVGSADLCIGITLASYSWLGTIPVIIDLFIMCVNGYLMYSIDLLSSLEDISSWPVLSLGFNLWFRGLDLVL